MSTRLIIKGGKLLDLDNNYHYTAKDIFIENGFIKKIADEINEENAEVLNLNGEIIAPGFIDMHTHVYPDKTSLGIDPDIIGVQTGTTTVFDAGSSGTANFEHFLHHVVFKSDTRVFSLLNIASQGLAEGGHELTDLKNINKEAVQETVERNRCYIKGIKARASASVVGELGIKPIYIAKQTASSLKLPLVVHIGNYPPHIEEVLNILDKGDIITHCFHGKPNGLFDEDGKLKKETEAAAERGVLFDIGHGTASFNFNIAKNGIKQGFYPSSISTDIYIHNYKGPVYSLAVTMSKMLNLGLTLEDCVTKVTTSPAANFRLDRLGGIKKGYYGDLTIFDIDSEQVKYIDSDGNCLVGNKSIKVIYVIYNGKVKKLSKASLEV